MRAVLLVGSGMAFLAQGVAALGLSAGWAAAYDVSGGDCGFDGTCSDQYSFALAALAWLVFLAAESVAGFVMAWAARRRIRRAADMADLSGTTAFPDLAGLLVERTAWAVLAGCAVSWLLLVQASLISHQVTAEHLGNDAAQGNYFIVWNVRAMALEVSAMVFVAAARLRRRGTLARGTVSAGELTANSDSTIGTDTGSR